jgi:hypothetical protein
MDLPSHILPRKLKHLFARPKPKSPDVVVISYPKSGRTWHRLLVGNYLARVAGVSDEHSMELAELSKRLGMPCIAYTHNGADMRYGYAPEDPRVAAPEIWEERKVILLVRDVKDVLVSAYHHARYRRSIVTCDFETFVRDPNLGARKVLTVMDRWAGNSGRASAHIVIRYEDMDADAAACLTRTLSFAGCGPVDAARVGEAVAFCTADNMRRLEQSNFSKAGQMRPGRDRNLGAKVRSASVGSHAKHMSDEIAAYVDEMDAAMGFPLNRLIATDPNAALS